ncbi:hypothetical protein E3E36_03860 [Thermococcus sp. M36]|uniref:hypothetical protein n=1 Tax=Thermococcus sp. M36 TaxID=1638261 RepID=UPI00143A98CD|nr:hypothetical protein [Thermococcus sp. M36]NJE05289.1 hypothetical protein [Thermococcus sp. M36]
MQVGKLASLVPFLFFAGAGLILLSTVALDVTGLPSRYMGLSVVLPLLLMLPLTKRLAICTGTDEETARRVAVLVGALSAVLFYLTLPRAGVLG